MTQPRFGVERACFVTVVVQPEFRRPATRLVRLGFTEPAEKAVAVILSDATCRLTGRRYYDEFELLSYQYSAQPSHKAQTWARTPPALSLIDEPRTLKVVML
ncbi:hypothetical protein [Rhodococcus sp. IEGM 1330]|uniref:hypothetical protein n=1 Tax=Rhodococcus sp. IEGM 1330 TaxID=3082225 RepID=UPI002952B0CC|nr:hypothetical protein [Rhodococcus sp. IEGM 1330]MDV8024612.1 hypothetical protein [Rhodococcus sp. IEGM 1330]